MRTATHTILAMGLFCLAVGPFSLTYIMTNAFVSRVLLLCAAQADYPSLFPYPDFTPILDSVCSAAIVRTLHGLRGSLERYTE
jgi:hypothetical protein